MQNPIDFYKQQLIETIQKLNSLKKKLLFYSVLRGVTFLIGAFVSFFSFKISGFAGSITIVLFLSLLFYFVKKYHNLYNEIEHYKIIQEINENEIKALDYDFSVFETGEEFIDTNHDYTFDLDVYGKGSVYQMINRSSTEIGKNRTNEYFNNPKADTKKIQKRQKAIEELKKQINWRQQFNAKAKKTSLESKNSSYAFLSFSSKNTNKFSDIQDFVKLKSDEKQFISAFWKYFLVIIPIISILLILATSLGFIAFNILAIYIIILLTISGFKIKNINEFHNLISNRSKVFKRYSELLEMIEKQEFSADELKNLQAKLLIKQTKASKVLKDFSALLNALDNRLNVFFAFLSNGFLLWDIQVVRRIELWQDKYSVGIESWFDVIAEFEFLNSLANFAYNNPEFVFPDISDEFAFSSQEMGHPIIPKHVRVTNDFQISEKTKSFIITGANMAGKSTFLRTIGINFILAQLGSVVCAKKMIVSPIKIMTSIRISDSLSSNESYFYAELKRLKYIIEQIEKGQNALVIIDEMLRGTNSEDKHNGSVGLLKKIVNFNVITFLATHDVALGKLEEEFPDVIKNYCFEAEIINDELKFDYKIRTGISRNLNASFLMRKMKII